MFEPKIIGHDWLAGPCFSFLIQNQRLSRSILFDLGFRKDGENLPPRLIEQAKAYNASAIVEKDVVDILVEGGVEPRSIEAVIWSHTHHDHTGNPATLPPETALVVGPGSKAANFPGYPANPAANFCEADVEGREIREIDVGASGLKIGRFAALDYFGDGSFYLLDAPGHAVGHVCGLARVKSGRASGDGGGAGHFIVMGGDVVHHAGEIRPSPWQPLPTSITPSPFTGALTCPGDLFHGVLRDSRPDQPFFLPVTGGFHHDADTAAESIRKLQELDAYDNFLVVAAHDESMLDVVDFFPKTANDFVAKGWVRQARWTFLRDFAKAVGYEGEIVGAADWSQVVE